MKIAINGKTHEFPGPLKLQALIQQVCQGQRHVIAELNEKIVKQEQWDTVNVCEGDRIELVSFVGGG